MSTDTVGLLVILGLIAMAVLGVWLVAIRAMNRHDVETDNPPISKSSMYKLLSRVRDEENTHPFKQTH